MTTTDSSMMRDHGSAHPGGATTTIVSTSLEPAVFARSNDEADRYADLLSAHGIDVVIGDVGTAGATRFVPLLVRIEELERCAELVASTEAQRANWDDDDDDDDDEPHDLDPDSDDDDDDDDDFFDDDDLDDDDDLI